MSREKERERERERDSTHAARGRLVVGRPRRLRCPNHRAAEGTVARKPGPQPDRTYGHFLFFLLT